MKPALIDAHLQQELNRKGFLRVMLLDGAAVGRLRGAYSSLQEGLHAPTEKFHSTSDTRNANLVAAVHQAIQTELGPALGVRLCNHRVLLSNFLVKESGADSAVPAHQDWSYVDEDTHFSLNIWIALERIGGANGRLWFVPGSHRFARTLRASPDHVWAYADCREEIDKVREAVEMVAGEALIFYHSTIHGSEANLSGNPRLAVSCTVTEDGADLSHFYVGPGGEITRYHLTAQDYMQLRKGEPPTAFRQSEPYSFRFPRLTPAEFVKAYGLVNRGRSVTLPRLWQKVSSIFNRLARC